MKIGGYIAFGCDCDDFDPDGAAIALRRAGFHVTGMPEEFRSRLKVPDDFVLVTTDGPDNYKFIDAIMGEINAIVDRYGGFLDGCGAIDPNRAPFEELFECRPRLH
jgi:hypothetical protein